MSEAEAIPDADRIKIEAFINRLKSSDADRIEREAFINRSNSSDVDCSSSYESINIELNLQ